AISGRHQPSGEANPLSLVTIKQSVRPAAGEDRRQFPGKIDGITDAGIHALSTGRAVDVSGVPQQECPALSEMVRYSVMHMIGGKPVHFQDLHLQVSDRSITDVLKSESVRVLGAFIAHGSNQSYPTTSR